MMDETPSNLNSLPPFIAKIYEMVEDPSSDSVVSWSQTNKSFTVWSPPEFARDLLPKFFKHNNLSSFIRQLNTYGFRKVDPEKWEFANDDFVRGCPHLLKNIRRRKPVYSHSTPTLASLPPLTELERKGYEEDIEKLKSDKELLHVELQRHKEEHQGQIRELTERLRNVECRHANMLSLLVNKVHQPVLTLDLMAKVGVHDRKRRFPRNNHVCDEVCMEDNLGASETFTIENLDANSLLSFNKELLEQLESSLTFWERIALDAGECLTQPPDLILDESASCILSPSISHAQVNYDIARKPPEIDMNSEPKTVSAEEVQPPGEPATNVRIGVNDVFWEQFLTENPGSNDSTKYQSARRDLPGKKNEDRPGDNGMLWWKTRNVDNLTQQLGHLSPAQRT